MKEIQEIIKAYEEATAAGKQCALATVVHLEGSAYRRPGARMLVTEDGQLTGAISGGCLEGDALRKAQLVMVQQKPMLVTYDTTDEDDAKLGVGLGCNGIISILIEPVHQHVAHNPIYYFKAIVAQRQAAVLVTLFSLDKKEVQPGTCMLITENGQLQSSSPEILEANLKTDALSVLQSRISLTTTYGLHQQFTGFIEMIEPAISLVIFGAGNDALPLLDIATVLGWQTTVVDGRANYANAQRFAKAKQVLVSKPEHLADKIHFDKNTVAVLMTHNYNYDFSALKELLPLHLPYIGALGPKKKLERMLDQLREEGVVVDEKAMNNIFGPSGLDIGAETAEEIALSIIAEIKTVLTKSSASFLREKETIHPRDKQFINYNLA